MSDYLILRKLLADLASAVHAEDARTDGVSHNLWRLAQQAEDHLAATEAAARAPDPLPLAVLADDGCPHHPGEEDDAS